MCVCDFDMYFTYVLAGWEGSANDARVLGEAIADPQSGFPYPPQGKYYLVDSGYAIAREFLPPYKGQRYHMSQYRGTGRQPRTAKEQFNYAHSSLRNVIERCFGVLKARFPILKFMPPYSLRKQRNIVIAACAIHNFIRKHKLEDELFRKYGNEDLIIEDSDSDDSDDDDDLGPSYLSADARRRGQQQMIAVRDGIRNGMAAYYQLPY
ncbi:hypothetical protein ACHQM5_027797 [Ranunculus cassubicifolius]